MGHKWEQKSLSGSGIEGWGVQMPVFCLSPLGSLCPFLSLSSFPQMRGWVLLSQISLLSVSQVCLCQKERISPESLTPFLPCNNFPLARLSRHRLFGRKKKERKKERNAQVKSSGVSVVGSYYLEAASRASQMYTRPRINK